LPSVDHSRAITVGIAGLFVAGFLSLAYITTYDDSATRAEVAGVLADIAGLADAAAPDVFRDDDGIAEEAAINMIAAAGATKGCSEDEALYCPDAPISRAGLATMIARLLKSTSLPRTDAYDDIAESVNALEINQMAGSGLVLPCNQDTSSYCPDHAVTREDLVVLTTVAETLEVAVGSPSLVALELVASGLDQPVSVVSPIDDNRLFIVEREGQIRILDNGVLNEQPFLDLSTDTGTTRENGLLSLAFHPDYGTNGRFFVVHSTTTETCAPHETLVAEFRVSSDPNIAESTGRTVLAIPQTTCTHKAGAMLFGPDGLLYISLGDGGDWYDNLDQAQDTTTLSGTVIRIDIDNGTPYAIPPDNPLVGLPGRDEIIAWGLRNPWRMTLDNGVLYIGDVGQDQVEEVDRMPLDTLGLNFGWPAFEGDVCVADLTPAIDCSDQGYTAPAITSYHPDAGSIIGGSIYRGSAKDLVGLYVYGDYITGRIRTATFDEAGAVIAESDLTTVIGLHRTLASIDTDSRGEMYLVNIFAGTIHRIVPSA